MSSSGFVDVANGRLFYRTDGTGPAVVCIHGAPMLDHRVWDPQINDLAQRHQIVRYDLRGYGQSSLPTSPYRHCDDLAALITQLNLSQPVVCGLSFGGTVAIDTALTHPDLVGGLILDAVAPITGWEWIESFPLAPALRLAGSATTAEVADAILALPMHDAARERPGVVDALTTMSDDYSGWHLTNRDPGRWAEAAQIDRLDEIVAPTLVITGGRDCLDARHIGQRAAAEIPNATHIEISTAGHLPNLEEPALFNNTAQAFLDTNHPTAR